MCLALETEFGTKGKYTPMVLGPQAWSIRFPRHRSPAEKSYERAAQEMRFDPLVLNVSFFIPATSCSHIALWLCIER
jgi:hypothetical protein